MRPRQIERGSEASPSTPRHDNLKADYVSEARKQHFGNSDLEIDQNPRVSISKSGAWVAAWVWVDSDTVESEELATTK